MGREIDLNQFIPPVYEELFEKLFDDLDSEDFYSVRSGRGAGKSSELGLFSVLGTYLNKGNVLCYRRHKTSLRDSVYAECLVAISRLELEDDFICTVSPLKITCKRTGKAIYFRGLDDPNKSKSLKSVNGGFFLLWFEEGQEYNSLEDIRSVRQTVQRGPKCSVVITFNPPSNPEHWVNKELLEQRGYHLYLTYKDIPEEWLGEAFLRLASELEKSNPVAYQNEYLGLVCGSDGMVFSNVRVLDESVKYDDSYVLRAVDFGFAREGDPVTFICCSYNEEEEKLYIFHEFFEYDSSYKNLAAAIKEENLYDFDVLCDCADSGGIKQLREYGVQGALPCRKPKDSVKKGLKWLQKLSGGIYIDPIKCPNVYREFSSYSYEKTKAGELVYSARNNHTIDAVRYACQQYIL